MRFVFYRNYTKMYTNLIERFMKYVTDSNGNISVDKLHKNGKRIMIVNFVNIFVGILLLGLGILSLTMLLLKDQYILGMILFIVFLFAGAFIVNFSPALFKVGFTFYMTSKCLVGDIVMSKCPFCGSSISDSDNFCGKCGAKFKLQTNCHNCDTINSHNARFCKKCGTTLAVKIDDSAESSVKTEIE